MLASIGTAAFAEEDNPALTPEMVLEWLDEGDEAAEDVDDQTANAALRLAEMVIALDNQLMAS